MRIETRSNKKEKGRDLDGRPKMKRYTSLNYLLSKAEISDKSIIELLEPCKSEVRVKIKGTGLEARTKCKECCKEGVDAFKASRCPEICNVNLSRCPHCLVCYPDKNRFISLCSETIYFVLRRCEKGCRTIWKAIQSARQLRIFSQEVPQCSLSL